MMSSNRASILVHILCCASTIGFALALSVSLAFGFSRTPNAHLYCLSASSSSLNLGTSSGTDEGASSQITAEWSDIFWVRSSCEWYALVTQSDKDGETKT